MKSLVLLNKLMICIDFQWKSMDLLNETMIFKQKYWFSIIKTMICIGQIQKSKKIRKSKKSKKNKNEV